ncbi:MFS transporter [Prolixibacteraceae bacterium]|nr:MFS transporter [Prolixibacteraceae bacterium]
MRSSKNIIWFMYSISIITFMTSVILAPNLLPIARLFEGPDAIIMSQLLVVAPSISALFLSVVWTKIRIPHQFWGKLLFLISLLIYGITGVLCFWESTFSSMLVTRLILGLAMGLISMLLVQRGHLYMSEAKERVFVKTQGLAVGISIMFLILLSGWLSEMSWNMPFLIYLLAFFPIMFGLWMYIQGIGLHPRKIERPQKYFMNQKFWMLIGGVFLFVLYITFYFLQLPFLVDRLPYTDHMQTAGLLGLLVILFILGGTFYAPIYHYMGRSKIYYLTLIIMGLGTYILSRSFDINRVFLSLLFVGTGAGLLFTTAYNSIRHHIPNDVYGLWKYKLLTVVFLAQVLAPLIIYACKGDMLVRMFFMGMAFVILLIIIVASSVRLLIRINKTSLQE